MEEHQFFHLRSLVVPNSILEAVFRLNPGNLKSSVDSKIGESTVG